MTAPYTPTWLAPSSPGQLCNFQGSNTSTDAINFTVKMASPKGALSPLSLMRLQAFRTGVGGSSSTPVLAWDEGWVGGAPAVQQLPAGASLHACGGNSSVVYNLGSGNGYRLYFMASNGTLLSAPVAAAVGTWRYENPLPQGIASTTPVAYSMSIVANRLYCSASITTATSSLAGLYVAQINADGTVGSWVLVPGGVVGLGDATWKNTGLLGGWDGSSTSGWLLYWNTTINSGKPGVLNINIADGSSTVAGAVYGSAPTVLRDNLAFAFTSRNTTANTIGLAFIGGTASAATAAVDVATISLTSGLISGSFAASTEVLPAAKASGTGIVLADGTVFYMGGSTASPPTAATATTDVYKNTATNLFTNGGVWTTSAQALPSATWQAGGGIAMPDYDVLGTTQAGGDSATEAITVSGGLLANNANAMAIASFKNNGSAIALVGTVGAFTTGTNTTVSPTFGQATTTGHLLTAWVSGSDQGPLVSGFQGGFTAATNSYNYAQAPNEVFTQSFTVPAGGIYINSISIYMGGYGGSISTIFGVWYANGTLICNSSQFNASNGLALRTASVGSVFVAGGNNIVVGFWHSPSGYAQWGVNSGTGNFFYAPASGTASGVGNISSFISCAGSGFVCGNLQGYANYSTQGPPSPITTATSGWLKAADAANGTEEVQLWYKPNCGAGETAPTFTSANGTSPLFAQLAEWSNVVTSSPVDSSGTYAQGAAASSMTVTNAAPDAQNGDLILYGSRWSVTANATATFSDSLNVTTSTKVRAGDNGASSTTRHAAFNYAIVSAATARLRFPYVVLVGGQGTGGTDLTQVLAAATDPSATPNDIKLPSGASSAWLQGLGTAASAATLGSGTLANNQDGTQTISVAYGAQGTLNGVSVGTIYIATLNYGDQLTITCQMVDLDGDPSPLATSTITIGQPPSAAITAPSGAGANGQPNIAIAYSPGAGGGPQQTWRITIVGGTTGMTLADSGVRTDQSNFWGSLDLAPMLGDETSYTLSATVTSTDTPMDALSTNSSTATTTFSNNLTAPAMPTGFTVSTDSTHSGVTFSWVNAAGSTSAAYNRLYYRRAGKLLWTLLADVIPASAPGVTQTYTLMDQLAIGATYEFAVSAIDATQQVESTLSSPLITNPDFEAIAASTATLWHSIGTELGSTGTLNYWTFDAGVPTILANVVTMPISARMRGGHPDWWDGTPQTRFTWTTGSKPGLEFHADSGNNCIQAWVDGTTFYLWKQVNGVATQLTTAAAALTTATAYWISINASGTTYVATLYNDSAGARGSQIAQLTAVVTDSSIQTGQMGLFNGTNGTTAPTASTTFGGALNNVCTMTGPAPAAWTPSINTGEPAFCLSRNAFAGSYSPSIYNANSGGSGNWNMLGTPLRSGTSYTVSGQVRRSVGASGGVLTIEGMTDGMPGTPTPAADGAWHAVSNTNTSGSNEFLGLHYRAEVGTAYFDNVTLNLNGTTGITVPTPSGGYTAMLHIPGGQGASVTTTYAPLMLKGGPTTKEVLESVVEPIYGQRQPLVRMGVMDYREMELTLQQYVTGDFAALAAVLAVMRGGSQAYLRTAAGHLLTVGLKPDHQIDYLPANYLSLRTLRLQFVETPNLYAASLTFGTARGIPTQVNGTVPPLDPSELGI